MKLPKYVVVGVWGCDGGRPQTSVLVCETKKEVEVAKARFIKGQADEFIVANIVEMGKPEASSVIRESDAKQGGGE